MSEIRNILPLITVIKMGFSTGIAAYLLVFIYLNSRYKKNIYKPKKDSVLVILILFILSFIGLGNYEISNVWNWITDLIIMAIVGLSIYFNGNRELELMNIKKITNKERIGMYLKSWEEDTKQKIILFSQIFFLLLTGAGVAGFAPIYTGHIFNAKITEGIGLFLMLFLGDMIYYIIGFWIGLLAPWFNLLKIIREYNISLSNEYLVDDA